jgi:hypothetical protein
MIVLFIATDGDTDLDREHVQYANMYMGLDAHEISLGHIVRTLIEGEPFELWPVTDMLHLFKNMRQRVRNHFLLRELDAETLSAAGIAAELGGCLRSRILVVATQ